MTAPALTQALVLEAPERVADGAGGFTEGWIVLGTLWAEIAARTGREMARGGTAVSRMSHRITVRAAPFGAPSRPQAGQRLRDGQRVFVIEAVAERGTDGRYLTCFAAEEVSL
jgi:head-tail adaptor